MFAFAVDAQGLFPTPYCGSTGNFTADDTYQTTLTTLLYSISTVNSLPLTYGFFNASANVSGSSQTLYVIGSCRGDLTAESCRACLIGSASDVRRLCPLQKGAVLYNENCTVRYSNASIFGVVTTDPYYPVKNPVNVTSPDTYNAALQLVLDNLRGMAAAGGSLRKYATTIAPTGFNKTYAMVQCTPDLTEQQCSDCLVTVVGRLQPWGAGAIRARIMAPSCQFRYAIDYQFFGEPLPLPAPPPPPGQKSNSATTVIIAVATSASALLVVGIIILLLLLQPKS